MENSQSNIQQNLGQNSMNYPLFGIKLNQKK